MDDSYEKMSLHLNRIYDATEDLMKRLRFLLGPNYAKYLVQRLIEMELPLSYWSSCGYKRLYDNQDELNRFNLIAGESYSYTAWSCEDGYVRRKCDVLAGLYFPENLYNVGDTVDIWIGSTKICTMVLDDLNKIYKPFFDTHWLYLIALQYAKVVIDTKDKPFYVIGIYIDNNVRRTVARCEHRLMAPNGKILEISGGFANFVDDNVDSYNSPPYVYAANLIKKHMRKFMKNKKENDVMVVYI